MSDKEWLKTQPAEILLEHCANFGVIAECECEAEVLAEKCTEKRAEKIIEAQEEQLEHEESIFKFTIVLALGALAVTFACGYMLELNHIHRLPEAAVGLICGFLLSAGAYACGSTEMLSAEQFDFEFFMIWLLPPIIFEAGFNMNASAFFENIGPTIFFAFIGTFASTFVVGGIVFYAGQQGWCYPLGLLASLVFGSLISATDPVTVLAVFQALGVKDDLFSMVFGESVLNDAVAIVLSRTLLSFNEPGAVVDSESVVHACVLFTTIFCGSMVIGLVYGVLSSVVFKKLDLRHHHEMLFMETALSTTFPFAAYYTAEALHLSGIVTILFCGIIMAQYTRNCFSSNAQVLTAQAYKCLAMVAETFVFVYLGMASFSFPIFSHTSVKLLLLALVACFVGRLHIYIGSWGTNCMRKKDGTTLPPINTAYQFLMWFSGLRGGVAFAIASVGYAAGSDKQSFPQVCGGLEAAQVLASRAGEGPWAHHCETSSHGVQMTDSLAILQTTLLIAVFTIFVFGGAITEVAIACDVLVPKDKNGKKIVPPPDPNAKESAWTTFSNAFIRPVLTFDSKPRKEEGTRFAAAVEVFATASRAESKPKTAFKDVVQQAMSMNAKEIKESLGSDALENALKDSGLNLKESNVEDKVDEMRMQLPMYSAGQLRKILEENEGDLEKAVRAARPSGKAMEML